jgi:hypothetical protein
VTRHRRAGCSKSRWAFGCRVRFRLDSSWWPRLRSRLSCVFAASCSLALTAGRRVALRHPLNPARGSRSLGDTRPVSPQVAHRPSVSEWLTGRQSPEWCTGRQSPEPEWRTGRRRQSPEWRTGRQSLPAAAHGQSVPHWLTGHQCPLAHGPSIPRVVPLQSVPGLAHVPSVLANSRFARLVLVRVVIPCAGHGGCRALASGWLRIVNRPPA